MVTFDDEVEVEFFILFFIHYFLKLDIEDNEFHIVYNHNILSHSLSIYIYIYIYYQSKVFSHSPNFLFLIQKGLFLMKQVKHHDVFICYIKYKYSTVNVTLV